MGKALKGSALNRWPARKIYEEFLQFDGSGTAAMVKGAQYATLTDNGTGDYTLTLTHPGAQILDAKSEVVGATPLHSQPTAIAANEVTIGTWDLAGSRADADLVLVRLTLSKDSREF